MSGFIEKIAGDIGDKNKWLDYRKRANTLPNHYGEAIEATNRSGRS